jgi:hypothetical protein
VGEVPRGQSLSQAVANIAIIPLGKLGRDGLPRKRP